MNRSFILRNASIRSSCSTVVANLPTDQDRPLEVVIRDYKAKRNTDQNARYWVMLHEISDQAWVDGKQYSAEVWHEHYKRKFIGVDDLPSGGTMAKTTTGLSVSEFAEYMTKCEADAAQMGVMFTAEEK